VIVDLPISLNLLFKFTKQASTVMASNFQKVFQFSTFSDFLQLEFVRLYLRNCNTSLWDWCHKHCFSSVSWCNFHHKNMMRLTSLESTCHFCFQIA